MSWAVSRSAMVRETFRMRWKALAERFSRWVAACNRALALSSRGHDFQTSAGPISELHRNPLSLHRSR